MKDFDMMYQEHTQTLHWHIKKPMELDALFAYYHVARKQRYLYYQEHCVKVNKECVKQNRMLQINDEVTIAMRHEATNLVPWAYPLEICYEDACVLIVNKPAGMLVHSDGVNTTHTLHNCIQHYYHEHQITCAVRSIHRLDQETSGLVLYCKIPFFQAYFDALLSDKKIERIYLAWVKGIMTDAVIIEKALGKDRHNAKKMRIHEQGLYACTYCYPKKQIQGATLVECHLKTGRTHQIRVHLAYLKHPILADPLYGTNDQRISRCALHAWKLKWYHPLFDKQMEITCPLPDDMRL